MIGWTTCKVEMKYKPFSEDTMNLKVCCFSMFENIFSLMYAVAYIDLRYSRLIKIVMPERVEGNNEMILNEESS